MTISPTEVITSVQWRLRWHARTGERLVAASLEPGASVSELARGAGLHVSQLFRWRCKHREGNVARLVPVAIVASPPREVETPSSTMAPTQRRGSQGIIEIELGSGHRSWVDCDMDGNALRRDLDALVRR